MLPTIERTLDKMKVGGKRNISMYDFKREILRARIRIEDVPHIIKDLRKEGRIDIRHKKIELVK